jgi:DNA-binding response OmpR family regulator
MSKRSVLVVEDNRDVLDPLGRLLELEGFNVIKAEDCTTAYGYIIRDRPDIIVTDLGLPEVTGLELIYCVRRMSDFADIPIIAISAHTKKYLEAAVTAGANAAIHKLEGFEILLRTINQLLAKKGYENVA